MACAAGDETLLLFLEEDRMPANDAEIFAAMRALHEREITVTLNAFSAWCLVAQVQLALRHPENFGPATDTTLKTLPVLMREIAPDGGPLMDLYRMGFNPEHDL